MHAAQLHLIVTRQRAGAHAGRAVRQRQQGRPGWRQAGLSQRSVLLLHQAPNAGRHLSSLAAACTQQSAECQTPPDEAPLSK